jgi:phage terminase small subunit
MTKLDKLRATSTKISTVPTTPKTPKVRKHRSPKQHPVFVRMWNKLIPEVISRENFKDGHLHQLEVLCDLYVEYAKLEALIEQWGFTYVSNGGRSGDQIKIRPEVNQMNRVRSEIRSYSKMLGLLLFKDTDVGQDEGAEEWD